MFFYLHIFLRSFLKGNDVHINLPYCVSYPGLTSLREMKNTGKNLQTLQDKEVIFFH